MRIPFLGSKTQYLFFIPRFYAFYSQYIAKIWIWFGDSYFKKCFPIVFRCTVSSLWNPQRLWDLCVCHIVTAGEDGVSNGPHRLVCLCGVSPCSSVGVWEAVEPVRCRDLPNNVNHRRWPSRVSTSTPIFSSIADCELLTSQPLAPASMEGSSADSWQGPALLPFHVVYFVQQQRYNQHSPTPPSLFAFLD